MMAITAIKSFVNKIIVAILIILGLVVVIIAILSFMNPSAMWGIAIMGGAIMVAVAIVCLGIMYLKKGDKLNVSNSELQKLKKEADSELQKLKKELEQAQAKIKHFDSTSVHVTQIQPALKVIFGDITFKMTDLYEENLEDTTPIKSKNPLSAKKFYQIKKFYRGVIQYSGISHLGVDLKALRCYKDNDRIIIYGSSSDFSSKSNAEWKWRLCGRIEIETWEGNSEETMELSKIEVDLKGTKKYEQEQSSTLEKRFNECDIIKSFKRSLDETAKEFIKLLLKPTGKLIVFEDKAPDSSLHTQALEVLIGKHNEDVVNKVKLLVE